MAVRRPRISELPPVLQPPARFLRGLVKKSPYSYEADGIATWHFSPFLSDELFQRTYAAVADTWPGSDNRWRLWIMTRSAIHCAALDGSFAEFGVYRAGCAFMILSVCQPRPARSYFLFDTFAGIPTTNLTENEERQGFGGRLGDVSIDEVRQRLAPWTDQVKFVVGDVFETTKSTETGPLSFVHLDLNASAPTAVALEYAWSRLLPGGMMVFDDYGWKHFKKQRDAENRFMADRGHFILELPTGQGLVIKQ